MSEQPNPGSPSASQPSEKGQGKTLEEIVREQAPEVFNTIPQDKRPQLARVTVQQVSYRSSPLPEPSELAAYNEIIPDGAERIMRMAEAQSSHRIEIEKKVVLSQLSQSARGQVWTLNCSTRVVIGDACRPERPALVFGATIEVEQADGSKRTIEYVY